MSNVNNLAGYWATYYDWNPTNELYVGTDTSGNVRRSRIEFNAPSPISSSLKLTITATLTGLSSPKGMIAVLSDQDYAPSSVYDSNNARPAISGLATSLAYSNGTQAGENVASGIVINFTFNYTGFSSRKKYYVYFVKYWNNGYNGTGWNQFNINDVNLTYTSYTKCTAPTNVKTNGSVIKPNGSNLTITWSGASGGTANPIKSYTIGYKVNNGTLTELVKGVTATSYIYTTNGAFSRGDKITFLVKAIGTASGYDSDYSTAGANVTINYLPSAPSIPQSNYTLASDGSVTVTVTIGSDQDSSQIKSIEYAESANGTKKKLINNQLSIDSNMVVKGASQKYYFWTFDGLEYSKKSTEITVSRNTKPTLEVSCSGQILTSTKSVEEYKYIISPVLNFSGNSTLGTKNIYNWRIYYGNGAENLNKVIENQSTTNSSFSYEDIRSLVGAGCYYKFEVTRNDGIEDSIPVTTDEIFYTTHLPTLEGIYNRADFSSIEPWEYFSKKIRFVLSYDEGFPLAMIKYKDSQGKEKEISVQLSRIGGFWVYDLNTLSLEAKAYTFSVTPQGRKYSNVIISGKTVLTKISDYGTATLSWDGKVNPFVVNASSLVANNFFNSQTPEEDSLLSQYGFSKLPEYDLYVNDGEKWEHCQAVEASYNSPENIAFILSGKEIYDIATKANLDMTSSTQQMVIRIQALNAFGDEINWTVTKDVDWVIGAEPKIDIFLMSFGEAAVLKENVPVIASIKVESYHGAPYRFRLEGQSGNSIFFSKLLKLSETSREGVIGHKTPVVYFYENIDAGLIESQVESLENDTIWNLTLDFYNGLSVNKTSDSELKLTRHIPILFSLDKCEMPPASQDGNSNKTLDVALNIRDFGFDIIDETITNITLSLQKLNDNDEWTDFKIVALSSDSNSQVLQFDDIDDLFDQKDFAKVRVKITTNAYSKIDGEEDRSAYGSSKIEYSQIVTIYDYSPTLSYRKNRIGINTNMDEEDSTSVFVIKVADERCNFIRLISANRTIEIDLSTGNISGAIIESGSW